MIAADLRDPESSLSSIALGFPRPRFFPPVFHFHSKIYSILHIHTYSYTYISSNRMPSPKGHGRRGNVAVSEKNRKGRLAEKALSFHGGHSSDGKFGEMSLLPRPRTVPDLRPSGVPALERSSSNGDARQPAKLTKLLLKVTIQRSLGAVQVLISPESTVEDLIAAALRQYFKESRRPVFPSSEPSKFDLHYSQFSLESLNREEKLMDLGSRNFFLCPKACDTTSSGASSCSKEAEKAGGKGFALPWLKFRL